MTFHYKCHQQNPLNDGGWGKFWGCGSERDGGEKDKEEMWLEKGEEVGAGGRFKQD